MKSDKKRELVLIGLGPGDWGNMTQNGILEIEAAEAVVGYSVYVDIIRERAIGKQILETGMGGEVERTNEALTLAAEGKRTVLVCSGDASLYGLAGLAYELRRARQLDVGIRVVPGVTAAISCNSILGAPIVEDFCTISLSDYMTPWEKIEKRVRLAVAADFVIALYNPGSKARPDGLEQILKIILEGRGGTTPVGVVRNAYRNEEKSWVTTLENFRCEEVDMFCTVLIGNEQTRILDGKMVTSRGYKIDIHNGRNIGRA